MVGPFVYFHTSCVGTAKALARLFRCLPKSLLVGYVISTIISWAGSFACMFKVSALVAVCLPSHVLGLCSCLKLQFVQK